MDWFKGKKTYIVAALAGIVTAVYTLGYIDVETYTTVMGFLGAGSIAALRAGVK